MQYITAWGALVHFGRLAPDEHVLITAASSSVGIAAIGVARAQGAISIATTRTAAKKEQLVAMGEEPCHRDGPRGRSGSRHGDHQRERMPDYL